MSIRKSASADLVFIGLDVHKGSITAAVLESERETPIVDQFFHDEASALAEHLDAPLLTVDGRLQRAPGIAVRFLSLGN